MLNRIGAAAAELEATAGTAETIVAADVFLGEDWTVTYEPEMQPLNVVREYPDEKAPIVGGASSKVSGNVLLRGSGTKGTAAAAIGDVLQGMGLTETADAGYSVTYVPDVDLASLKSFTAKQFKDGKQITACGVRANGTFTLRAGEIGKLAVDGSGAFSSYGDEATLASPSFSPEVPTMLSGNMYLLEHHTDEIETHTGEVEELRQSTGTANEKIAVAVNQSTEFKPVFAFIFLTKQGTPAGDNDDCRVCIYSDSTGDPNTAITNGTSNYVDCSNISTTGKWVAFKFSTPPTMAASTAYHVVLEGRFTQSDDDNLQVGTVAVAEGAQITKVLSASSWVALALKNMSFMLVGAAEPTLTFDGAEINLNNEVVQTKDVNGAYGYAASDIVGRRISIGLEPLEKLDATRDLLAYLDGATDLFFRATLGTTAGNTITWQAMHCVSVKSGPWGDRDGQVTHPVEIQVENPSNFAIYFDAP